MKCSNCSADAVYTVDDPGVSVVYYCNKCLPESLKARANAGQLDLPKEEPKKSSKKKDSEPASEPAPKAEATDENPAS